ERTAAAPVPRPAPPPRMGVRPGRMRSPHHRHRRRRNPLSGLPRRLQGGPLTATVRRAELTAVDQTNQLIRPFTTTEVIRQPERCPDGVWRPVTRLHTVTHPALLDQVEHTITGSQLGREVFRSIPQSKPAARLDCLAFLDRINRQAR